MLGKSKDQKQRDLFNPMLIDFIDRSHELVLLAEKVDWQSIENELSRHYSHTGKPSMPIRFMVGCLLLKRLYNLGDETVAKAWVMNPYMQYFTGGSVFEHQFPCDPSDFVHFRNRIGEEGVEYIFASSVKIHGKDAFSNTALSDTTVQGNNTTYPTDAKLADKIIERCNQIAKKEAIVQRQTYTRTKKVLIRHCYNSTHPRRKKNAKKATKKLQTLAGRQLRELERKLSQSSYETYKEELHIFHHILQQKRGDSNKIYSIHKPFTSCIAKGKAHKKYEFGNKVGLMVNAKNLIIQAIEAFEGNPHDSKTIEPLLKQAETNFNYAPEEVVYDRGGAGRRQIGKTQILTPSKPKLKDTPYQKSKKRKKIRRRAAIEPLIGHLKKEFRMAENYLSGSKSPKINALLAASGWNFKKMMEKLKRDFLWPIFKLLSFQKSTYINFLSKNF